MNFYSFSTDGQDKWAWKEADNFEKLIITKLHVIMTSLKEPEVNMPEWQYVVLEYLDVDHQGAIYKCLKYALYFQNILAFN